MVQTYLDNFLYKLSDEENNMNVVKLCEWLTFLLNVYKTVTKETVVCNIETIIIFLQLKQGSRHPEAVHTVDIGN